MGKPFSNALELKHLATPSGNPPSGAALLYVKSDGKVYTKSSAGVETAVDTTGGGGSSVPVQPSEPTGTVEGHLWYDSDDETALAIDTSNIVSGVFALARLPVALSGTASATELVRADDARLSDPRAPTAHTHSAADLATGTVNPARLGSGTADATTYLRGDNTWAAVEGGGGAQPLADAYRGQWAGATAYAVDDIVSYLGKSYVCTVAHTSGSPVDPVFVGKSMGTVYSGTTINLVVPATAQVGDTIFLTSGTYTTSTAPTFSGGSGAAWTVLQGPHTATGWYSNNGYLHKRTVQAADIGATITVTLANNIGAAMLNVYRNAPSEATGVQITHSATTSTPGPTPLLGTKPAGRVLHNWVCMTPSSQQPSATVDAALSNSQVALASGNYCAGTGEEAHTSGATAARNFTAFWSGGNTSGIIGYAIHMSTVQPTPDFTKFEELPFLPEDASGSGSELAATTDYVNTTPSAPSTGIKMFARHRARRLPSYVGPTGQDSQIQPAIFSNRVAYWSAVNNSTTDQVLGMATPTLQGTTSAVGVASTSFYTGRVRKRLTTTSTANTSASLRTTAQWFTSATANTGGFFFVCRFGLNTVSTNTRGFVGFSADTGALSGGTNPIAMLNLCGFGWNDGSTTMGFLHNDGSGSGTFVDLGSNFPITTSPATYFYEVRMFAPSGAGNEVYWSAHRLNDGVVVAGGPVTTDLPVVGTLLAAHMYYSNGLNSLAQSIDVQSLYIETDN